MESWEVQEHIQGRGVVSKTVEVTRDSMWKDFVCYAKDFGLCLSKSHERKHRKRGQN